MVSGRTALSTHPPQSRVPTIGEWVTSKEASTEMPQPFLPRVMEGRDNDPRDLLETVAMSSLCNCFLFSVWNFLSSLHGRWAWMPSGQVPEAQGGLSPREYTKEWFIVFYEQVTSWPMATFPLPFPCTLWTCVLCKIMLWTPPQETQPCTVGSWLNLLVCWAKTTRGKKGLPGEGLQSPNPA